MMPGLINDRMNQPLLAGDVVRFVGEPVAVVVTEDSYQGEDATELVDIDYDVRPAVVDMADARSGTPGCCSRGRHQRGGHVRQPRQLRRQPVRRLRGVVSRTIENQRVARPDGDPRGRSGLGRRRPADRVDS